MDRLTQITTLAEEMSLSVEQLIMLLGKLDGSASGSRLRCSVVVNLFSRLVDRSQFTQVEDRLTREEQATVRHILGELYYFNEENPTGHYRLNLERKYDCSLADKILELNNEERVLRLRRNYADTSQRGNLMNFRNESLNGTPFSWNGA
jgi:predicted nucleic acid-binding protein